MNILFLMKYYSLGGVEMVTNVLASRFLDNGCRVSIVSFIEPSNEILCRKDSRIIYYLLSGFNTSKKNIDQLRNILIEEKIDINSFDGLELLTALKMNNTRIALQLLRHGIITDGDEMKSNPLLFAIKIGSRELVEELMTKHRHLVAVYTNEYVKNYTILDIAKRYKNDQIIQTVKKYL